MEKHDLTDKITHARALDAAATGAPCSTRRAHILTDGEYDFAVYSGDKLWAEAFGRCSAGSAGRLPAEANAELIAHARNHHAALWDVAEAAARAMRDAIPVACDVDGDEHIVRMTEKEWDTVAAATNALHAALARLAEVQP